MDHRNLFLTPATYRLIRLEYAVALLLSVVVFVAHFSAVRWWEFAVLFVYIDVIGYLPGAFAWRRAKGRPISKAYYVLYNAMHSLVSAALVAGVWAAVFGANWALLAIPIHLGIDRAIFGNFLKPFGLPFEPETHPAYRQLRSSYDDANVRPVRALDLGERAA
jgi:hypothetical protein